MALFGVFFNLFRLIHATVLITDVGKNAILRSFMFEFPWQFGITALACYLFGVVHTLACSSRAIYMSWVKSQMIVDIASIIMVVLPFLTINPMSIVAGYYAQKGDIEKAIIFTETIYYLWLIYTFLLGTMVLLAGLRLLRLLNNHLSMQGNDSEENVQKIKLGATKVKIIIGIGCFCLWAFSIMIAIYATSRHSVMLDSAFTIILTALALFNGPLATSIIEFAILMDLKMFRGLSNLSFNTSLGSASRGGASGNESRMNTSKGGEGSQNCSTACNSHDHGRSTNTSETIQLDQWNRFLTKDNKNNDNYNNYDNEVCLEKLPPTLNNNNGFRSLSPPPAFIQQSPPSSPPPQSPVQQQQSFGYSLSAFSPIQQQGNLMMIDGVDHHHSPFPISSLENDRYYYQGMNDQHHQYDGNESFSSGLHDQSNVSATHLVGYPHRGN
ncbi:unnamed protein product [Cunninghamella echinulata]